MAGNIVSAPGISEYNQTSFSGGMNLLVDDTRLQANEYRLGFNVRNRYDVLDEIANSTKDTSLSTGILQEILTFGNYIIAFVSGNAYYRLYSNGSWQQIVGFRMDISAPRYWTIPVPLATTNYIRIASPVSTGGTTTSALLPINQYVPVSGQMLGNIPGLLVQDNLNQPQFIYLDQNSNIQVRTTQSYDEWNVSYDKATGALTVDKREYVPIGNCMAWVDGVLYIVSQDFNSIYRSVSGRPLDFVINVAIDGSKGGDATTTSYSVGVGGISCIRPLPDDSLFVSASNSNFSVSKNLSNVAPKEFGEYTFIRKFLFESTCLSDRCIIDSLGDTKFVDLTGVRSFNAIQQLQNEGRNSPFTAKIQAAFKGVTQTVAAAIYFNNYEYYAVNTIFGPVIAVYDTINNSWASFDTTQVGGSFIKAFAKIELAVQALYAITVDNKLYQLYSGSTYSTATVLTPSVSSNMLYANTNIKMNNPRNEVKLAEFRCILNRITSDCTITAQPFVDNNQSTNVQAVTKKVTYKAPNTIYNGPLILSDVNSRLANILWPFPNCEQGWKVSVLLSWNGGGSITQFSMSLRDETPMNPVSAQTMVE